MTGREMCFLLAGYLSGSVLYSYLLPKYLLKIDVTAESEDGNPGAANAFAHAGPLMGSIVLLLELLKGFLPVHFAIKMLDPSGIGFGLVMAAPVLGHAFPFWNLKKGGKAIAVSFGVLLGLIPHWTPVLILAALYLIFSLILVIRPHFYRSILTFALFFAGVAWKTTEKGIILGSGILSVIVIIRHFARYHGERLEIRIFGKKPGEIPVDKQEK